MIVLKGVLISECPLVRLFEVITADIDKTENVVKKSVRIFTFCDTPKKNLHLWYYKTFKPSNANTLSRSTKSKLEPAHAAKTSSNNSAP